MEPEDQEREIEMESEPIVIGGGAVNSVNGKTGDVVLTTSDLENDSDYQTGTEVDNAISTAVGDEATARENADNNLQEQIDDKQDTLTAGENITIENNVISAIAGGGVKTLTADDYNYPTANPDGIALWTLDEGQYIIEPQTAYYLERYDRRSGSSSAEMAVFILKKPTTSGRGVYIISSGGSVGNTYVYYSIDADGGNSSNYLLTTLVENNLTSFSTTSALSARQGKALKDLIDSLVITGAGAPTTSTTGTVGQLYEDTTNGKLYQCTAVSGGTYTWEEVGAGGGGVTPVQTTGTSTSDVMSQDATTKMVYGWNSGWNNYDIKILGKHRYSGILIGYNVSSASNEPFTIGNNSISYNRGVAIGNSAHANGSGAISLGDYSGPSLIGTQTPGVMDIGSRVQSYGYNNTNYRLLTGVHDGQDAHDAATLAQGNTLATSAPTTSTVGVLGQLYTDTTNMHTYQCTAISGGTYTWTQRW